MLMPKEQSLQPTQGRLWWAGRATEAGTSNTSEKRKTNGKLWHVGYRVNIFPAGISTGNLKAKSKAVSELRSRTCIQDQTRSCLKTTQGNEARQ